MKLSKLKKDLKSKINEIKKKKETVFFIKPRAIVVGEVSHGKSSFLNFLIGQNIFKTGIGEVTTDITKLSKNNDLLSLSIWNKKNEDYHDTSNFDFISSYNWDKKYEFFDFIELIDIPGFDGSYNQNIIDFLENYYYDIVFFVIDISKGFKKQSLEILEKIKSKNPYILFLINKTDMVIEDSSIDEINDIIEGIERKVKENISNEKVLGYLPISSKNTSKEYIKTLQEILILTSYVSVYKIINYFKFDIYLKELLDFSNEALGLHNNLTRYYLENLGTSLDNTANMDLLFFGKETIENIINNLNNQLKYYMTEIIYDYKDDVREETNIFLNSLEQIMITYSDIVDFNSKEGNISSYNPLIYQNINIDISNLSSELDDVFGTIFQTIGVAFLAKLSLSFLLPGIGTIIAIAAAIWNASSKAQEIRDKVFNEVYNKLPNIIYEQWFNLLSELYEKQRDIIIEFENELYKISDKLIEGVKDINKHFSNELLQDLAIR